MFERLTVFWELAEAIFFSHTGIQKSRFSEVNYFNCDGRRTLQNASEIPQELVSFILSKVWWWWIHFTIFNLKCLKSSISRRPFSTIWFPGKKFDCTETLTLNIDYMTIWSLVPTRKVALDYCWKLVHWLQSILGTKYIPIFKKSWNYFIGCYRYLFNKKLAVETLSGKYIKNMYKKYNNVRLINQIAKINVYEFAFSYYVLQHKTYKNYAKLETMVFFWWAKNIAEETGEAELNECFLISIPSIFLCGGLMLIFMRLMIYIWQF